MRTRRAALIAAALLACPARASATPEDQAASAVSRAAQRYHLCVVAASVDHGRVRSYVAGSARGAACDEHTRFELGSVTKVLTGFVLASQIADGRVREDEPVAQLLPGWAIPRRGRPMNLLDLATHTSGLPRDSSVDDDEEAADPDATYSPQDMRAELASLQIRHAPGDHYEYSNLGAGLLGYALAQRAATPLQTQISRTVLQPLSMRETWANLPGSDVPQPILGYRDDGSRANVWHASAANLGASGYVSTLHDMTIFLRAMMDPSCLGGLCATAQPTTRERRRENGLFLGDQRRPDLERRIDRRLHVVRRILARS